MCIFVLLFRTHLQKDDQGLRRRHEIITAVNAGDFASRTVRFTPCPAKDGESETNTHCPTRHTANEKTFRRTHIEIHCSFSLTNIREALSVCSCLQTAGAFRNFRVSNAANV